MKVKVLQGQTIFDIALEYLGSLDYLCNIIRDNNIGITYDISGMELDVYPENIGNEIDKKFLKGFSCCNKYDIEIQTPTNLVLTLTTDTQIDLEWVGVSGYSYKIERSINGIDFTLIATTGNLVYSDTGLIDGVKYYYRVFAFLGTFNSDYSPTENETTPLNAPTLLQLDDVTDVMEFSWTNNSNNSEITFNIEYSIDNADWETLDNTTEAYGSSSFVQGNNYVRVQGVIGTIYSDYSNTILYES